jgi:hypothetical protein
MNPLSKVTIEVNNEDLADLYTIIGENKTYFRYASIERRMIESWQSKWSEVYEKYDNFYLVFDEEDIDVLFSVIRQINPYRYPNGRPKRIMSEELIKFLQEYSS